MNKEGPVEEVAPVVSELEGVFEWLDEWVERLKKKVPEEGKKELDEAVDGLKRLFNSMALSRRLDAVTGNIPMTI